MKRMGSARKRSNSSATSIDRPRSPRGRPPTFAVCVDNSEYVVSLELHKVYRVVADPDAKREGELRVIDESGEDYLYPADRFVAIDLTRSAARELDRSYGAPTSERRPRRSSVRR